MINRFVGFTLSDLNKWKSNNFKIYNEDINYTIEETNYSIKETSTVKSYINKISLNEDKPDKDIPKDYTLKKFSFVNGLSTNILGSSKYIEELAIIAEYDMFKSIIKNCPDEYDTKVLATMLYLISVIDTIRYMKAEHNNELYDYNKFRNFICCSIYWYCFPEEETIARLINWITVNLFKRKQSLVIDYIKESQEYISLLLLVETNKGNSKISILLSDCITKINALKNLKK
jgi:hypothetical protein